MPTTVPHLEKLEVKSTRLVVDHAGNRRAAPATHLELRPGDVLIVSRTPMMSEAERERRLKALLEETLARKAPDPLPKGYETAAEALARLWERHFE